METSIISASPDDTEHAGRQLARLLNGGEVVLIDGELGAGKTVFVRGIAREMGYTGDVTSPTFALINEYRGSRPLCHMDAYRLNTSDDLADTGLYDYLDRGWLCVIEWGSRIDGQLIADYEVNIERVDDSTRRIVIWGAKG